jgi:hypothetical protein
MRALVWMKAAMKLTNQETAYLNLTKGFEMGLMGAGLVEDSLTHKNYMY